MNKKDLEKAVKYIGSWLPFRFRRTEIPGMVVAIAHKDKIIFKGAYGYANIETKEKMTTNHVFRIASHSKTFTATAIMQLQEKGKLRIDDYAAGYLPWLNKHSDKRFHKITIRQLLSHGAGIIRDGNNADYWQLLRKFPNEDEFKKETLEAKLIIDNNIKLKYSNYGYTLLGMVVAAVSKQPYNDYVQKNIVDVLGLKNTVPEINTDIRKNLATGYSRKDLDKRLPIAGADTRAMSSATGFCSTAEDMCIYFSAHNPQSNKLLDPESKKEMQRTQWKVENDENPKGYYGLGLTLDNINNNHLIGHGGGFPGYITKSFYDTKNDIAVIVLTNAIDGGAGAIAKGIYGVINKFDSKEEKPKQEFSKFEGRFMDLWNLIDIATVGNKIYAGYPNSWTPFKDAEELEYVDDQTLKVIKANSYSAESELVKYIFDAKNNIIKVVYNGVSVFPEDQYLKSIKTKKEITLK